MTTTPAPQTLTELHALLAQVRQGRASVRLGKRAADVLGQLLDAPRETAVGSITRIALTLDISPSTLSRLAKRLGYSGFGQFQDVFRQHFTGDGKFYSSNASRLIEDDASSQANVAVATKIARQESKNVAEMLADLKEKNLAKTVDLLVSARSVRVLGLRQSASLASYFAYCLGMLRGNVALLSEVGNGTAHGLAQMDAGDVLVVFGCRPYTRTTVTATHIAAAKGTEIIAITDNRASPLAVAAKQVFVVPTESMFYSNSMAAIMVLCEAMLTMVVNKLPEQGLKALRDRERIIAALEVESV